MELTQFSLRRLKKLVKSRVKEVDIHDQVQALILQLQHENYNPESKVVESKELKDILKRIVINLNIKKQSTEALGGDKRSTITNESGDASTSCSMSNTKLQVPGNFPELSGSTNPANNCLSDMKILLSDGSRDMPTNNLASNNLQLPDNSTQIPLNDDQIKTSTSRQKLFSGHFRKITVNDKAKRNSISDEAVPLQGTSKCMSNCVESGNDDIRDIKLLFLENLIKCSGDKPSIHSTSKKVGYSDDSENLPETTYNVKIDPRQRHLVLEILSGKAFLDHLLDESPVSMLMLCGHFRGQRFWTPRVPCACEPKLKANFILELHKDVTEASNRMADSGELLGMSDPIHLVLLKILDCGDMQLLSSHFLDWREVLAAHECKKTFYLEMLGVGAESRIPVGVIEVRLSLLPKLNQPLSLKVISAQTGLEKSCQSEKERSFLVYAKTWWKDYLAERPAHSMRTIKIFSQDENGHMRPVFQYLSVMKVGWPLLEMPREAAWFVSLFPCESSSQLDTLPACDQWWNTFTFLCLKRGGPENHALLLCSLLLGFGLDAYVCIGTKQGKAPWSWVLTYGGINHVTLWESTTGARYLHVNSHDRDSEEQENPVHAYSSVGCVFNNKSFYAISQNTDEVKHCSFDLKNPTLWKSMSETAIASLTGAFTVPLMPGWSDPMRASIMMEERLKHAIIQHRQDLGLSNRWHPPLCHLLGPLLSAYELEHKSGVEVCMDEFLEIISHNLPQGFAVRALPLRVPVVKPSQVLRLCLRNDVLKGIITCEEPDVKLALRVRTYVYPENVLSMWLILACKFRTVTKY